MDVLEEHITEENKATIYLSTPIVTDEEYLGSVRNIGSPMIAEKIGESISSSSILIKKVARYTIPKLLFELEDNLTDYAMKSAVYPTPRNPKLGPLMLYSLEVQKAKWMLSLEEGWDDMDAKVITPELFEKATNCV